MGGGYAVVAQAEQTHIELDPYRSAATVRFIYTITVDDKSRRDGNVITVGVTERTPSDPSARTDVVGRSSVRNINVYRVGFLPFYGGGGVFFFSSFRLTDDLLTFSDRPQRPPPAISGRSPNGRPTMTIIIY